MRFVRPFQIVERQIMVADPDRVPRQRVEVSTGPVRALELKQLFPNAFPAVLSPRFGVCRNPLRRNVVLLLIPDQPFRGVVNVAPYLVGQLMG